MLAFKRVLIAVAAAGIALPAAAQSSAPPKMESEKVGQETPYKKKTPEQIEKDKATKKAVDAEQAKKGQMPLASERVGQEVPAKKKTPEQIAKEKADKAKRGTTPEEQAKQAKALPGG
jgi:hypothetical protein